MVGKACAPSFDEGRKNGMHVSSNRRCRAHTLNLRTRSGRVRVMHGSLLHRADVNLGLEKHFTHEHVQLSDLCRALIHGNKHGC